MVQSDLKKELELIFERQIEFGLKVIDNFRENFIKQAFHKRPLKGFEKLIGLCTFYGGEGERRAAKNSYSALEFVTLTKVINELKHLSGIENSDVAYCKDKVKEIVDEAFKEGFITYGRLRELTGLNDKISFKVKDTVKDENSKFIEIKAIGELKRALGDAYSELDRKVLNEISEKITTIKDKNELKSKLQGMGFPTGIVNELIKINFSGYVNLSYRALDKIIPIMRMGKRYDEAVEELGLEEIKTKSVEKTDLLPPLKDTVFGGI